MNFSLTSIKLNYTWNYLFTFCLQNFYFLFINANYESRKNLCFSDFCLSLTEDILNYIDKNF